MLLAIQVNEAVSEGKLSEFCDGTKNWDDVSNFFAKKINREEGTVPNSAVQTALRASGCVIKSLNIKKTDNRSQALVKAEAREVELEAYITGLGLDVTKEECQEECQEECNKEECQDGES